MPAGRPKNFTPQDFIDLWEEYVEWAESHPLYKYELNQRTGEVVAVPLKRAINVERFIGYVYQKTGHEIHQYFKNQDNGYTEFLPIITRIRAARTAENIEGGMSGLYNANLTARINSIKEATDVTTNGKDIGTITVSIVEGKKEEE